MASPCWNIDQLLFHISTILIIRRLSFLAAIQIVKWSNGFGGSDGYVNQKSLSCLDGFKMESMQKNLFAKLVEEKTIQRNVMQANDGRRGPSLAATSLQVDIKSI